MRFLYPSGGDDIWYGYITQPGRYGISLGIKNGKPWAADNQAFTQGFQPDKFFPWLEGFSEYRDTCLFVAIPDSVANWVETNDRYRWFAWKVKEIGFPVAYVAQDGCEYQKWPDEYDALFLGGSTEWKLSDGAKYAIRRAEGKHIHIGRVNYWRRYSHFRIMEGSEDWTCDGTAVSFDPDAKGNWKRYEKQPPLFDSSIFDSNSHR